MMGVMASKYAGKCKTCRKAYSVGADIYWTRATGALCLACQPGARASETPRATTRATTTATGEGIGNKALRRYESWQEYVDTAAARPDHGRTGKFYGGVDFAGALAMARQGYQGARAEVDALTEKISDHITPILKPAFESYFDVSGGMVDVGRFLDGEPECMVETRLVEIAKPGRVISILVNGCFSAGISQTQFRQRGAAIVGLVDALEKCQYSTEVWLEVSHKTVSYLVKVKGAEDMLDIDILMFAIGHEACFRQLSFAIQDGEKASLQVGSNSGMGYVWKLSCAELVSANVCLEPLIYNDPTANAEVWIKERLSEFGLVKGEGE